MAGAPIRLGPFVGGLNIASDPTAIADAELTECHNLELDLDGSLISRTPFQEKVGDPGFSERIVLLCEAVFGVDHYLIGSNSSGVYRWLAGQWARITSTFRAAAAVQYADKVYLIPHPSSGTGGKWDPSGGFTAVAAIPKGQAAVIHKERLFIAPGIDSSANSSRLVFSNSGNFDVWTGTDFIDISAGDGTKLIDLTVFQNNLMLFKNQSTYFMSYDIRPSDAVIQKISSTIGVGGQYQVVNYENQVYCIHNGAVYEILNLDFNRINIKVPFPVDQSVPAGMSFASESVFLTLLGDRLLCRFYKKIFIYGLQTRSWSEWEAEQDVLIVGATATCAGASTASYFVTTDADAADIPVGSTVRIRTSEYILKEATEFLVTFTDSAFGFTNIHVTPNFATAPVTGDILEVLTHSTKNLDTHYFGPIVILHPDSGNEYYAGSSLSQSVSLIRLFDKHTASDTEQSLISTLLLTDTFTRSATDTWGRAETGQVWITSGGSVTDFDVTGSKGTHTLTTTSVFRTAVVAAAVADQNLVVTIETAALATGSTQIIDILLRYIDANNAYYARVEFTTTATVVLSILKIVAGVQTVLTTLNPVPALTHAANTQFRFRAKITGTQLAAKVWLASNAEPLAWNLSVYDAIMSTPGFIGIRTLRNAGNTNANLVFSFDDLQATTLSTQVNDIECWIRTKNFDMAVSHQFKRLWWWGADVSTSRAIEGIAQPIVVTFQVYWGDLIGLQWGDELDNFWGEPLSDPVVIDTLVPTSSGVARQFVKFLKALRYRQINFKVKLLTAGSKLDGPARIFSMTIITETKQVVGQAVN